MAMPVSRRLSSLLTSAQISRVTAARPNPGALAGVVVLAAAVAVLAGAVAVAVDGASVESSLLTGGQMLTGRQIQEHRLEVWLDRGQLGDVQALIGQQPGDDCKVELVVDQADLENPIG